MGLHPEVVEGLSVDTTHCTPRALFKMGLVRAKMAKEVEESLHFLAF